MKRFNKDDYLRLSQQAWEEWKVLTCPVKAKRWIFVPEIDGKKSENLNDPSKHQQIFDAWQRAAKNPKWQIDGIGLPGQRLQDGSVLGIVDIDFDDEDKLKYAKMLLPSPVKRKGGKGIAVVTKLQADENGKCVGRQFAFGEMCNVGHFATLAGSVYDETRGLSSRG